MESSLFEDHAGINLLSTLLPELYTPKSKYDVTRDYISSKLKRLDSGFVAIRKDLENLQQQLIELEHELNAITDECFVLNERTCLTLSLIFGSIFTKAIEILENRENVKIYSLGDDELAFIKYGTGRIMVTVTEYESAKKLKHVNKEDVEAALVKQEFLSLLAKMGLIYENNKLLRSDQPIGSDSVIIGNPRPKSHHISKTYHTDMYLWYCSCDQYQICYVNNWLTANKPEYFKSSNIQNCLLFSNIKWDNIDPLPICSHLLVLLIIKANLDKCLPFTVLKLNNFSYIL